MKTSSKLYSTLVKFARKLVELIKSGKLRVIINSEEASIYYTKADGNDLHFGCFFKNQSMPAYA